MDRELWIRRKAQKHLKSSHLENVSKHFGITKSLWQPVDGISRSNVWIRGMPGPENICYLLNSCGILTETVWFSYDRLTEIFFRQQTVQASWIWYKEGICWKIPNAHYYFGVCDALGLFFSQMFWKSCAKHYEHLAIPGYFKQKIFEECARKPEKQKTQKQNNKPPENRSSGLLEDKIHLFHLFFQSSDICPLENTWWGEERTKWDWRRSFQRRKDLQTFHKAEWSQIVLSALRLCQMLWVLVC